MVWNIANLVLLNPIKMLLVKDVCGIENIPKPPFIVASNHASYLDPFIIIKVIYDKFKKKTHYIAKPGRWGHKLGKKIFLDYAGCIPTDIPKNKFFSIVNATLNNGGVIGVFPEGERSSDGKIKSFKKGIGRMILESKVPLVPIAIKGNFDIWPINRKLPRIKKIIKVKIGKEISFKRGITSDKNCIRIASDAEKKIKKMFKRL